MIEPEAWRRLEPVIDEAWDLHAEGLGSYLDRELRGDPEIRREAGRIAELLRMNREWLGFLDSPPHANYARILVESGVTGGLEDSRADPARIGPYDVIGLLGRGGMGVVYLARDPVLDRGIALKLLPPWLGADERAARRLTREARAASALDHPNVETIYGVGSTPEGRAYIAMAHYEGETLKDRIRRGPLSLDEVTSIARQLAAGLRAAHEQGIVHRDVKPANVILTEAGVVKIVDFGIATAVGADRPGSGVHDGTLAYMSPERTDGRAVDARADVWSFGVVVYEMLAGRRRFPSREPTALISDIRHAEPEPLHRLRPDAPDALVRMVDRCLRKGPGARFDDAAGLARALNGVAVASSGRRGARLGGRALTAVVASSLMAISIVGEAPGRGADEGIAVAHTEAFLEYEKGVHFLGKLEGEATRRAWEHFERALDLDPTFAAAWAGLAGTYNQLAVHGELAATEAAPRAREAAERALALDPESPEAHAHLAAVLSWYYGDAAGAERHFERAIALQPGSARAHRHYAVHLRNQGRFEDAMEQVRRAGEISPLSPGTYTQEVGILYMWRRYDDALDAAEQLLRVEPRHTPAHVFRGQILSQMGRYEEALEALATADPDMEEPSALAFRGYVLGRLGRVDEARGLLARLRDQAPPSEAFAAAVVHVGLGEYDRALDRLRVAVSERTYQVQLLGVEPVFDPLRSDPRFQALLTKPATAD